MKSSVFQILDNEDGVLVVLPRVQWISLSQYKTPSERLQLLWEIKTTLQNEWLPITWGFEVKLENIMVLSEKDGKLELMITDLGARVDQCISASSLT